MQKKLKKQIKSTIYIKKINSLKSFAILFKNNEINNSNITRISRTSFLKLNKSIFKDKILPANIYFCTYTNITELTNFKDNIILIKQDSNYFFPNHLDSLIFNNNVLQITSLMGFYKKFYLILKTISCKI